MKQKILSYLPGDHPWQKYLKYYNCLPSTNDTAKQLAMEGAPEGTVVVAAEQTAGRGRLGRTFYAPDGLGLYFSLILRPDCSPEKLMHLTCAAAVAVCNAVQDCTGVRPQIKWTNDLIIGNKKLGGILTELSVHQKVDWVVLGIGINCGHHKKDLPPEIRDMATSLLLSTKKTVSPAFLAACLIRRLYEMNQTLLTGKDAVIAAYRADCMTVGQQIVLIRGDEKRYGQALDVTNDGGLLVKFDDGKTETVQSGEVSVRGLYGYT